MSNTWTTHTGERERVRERERQSLDRPADCHYVSPKNTVCSWGQYQTWVVMFLQYNQPFWWSVIYAKEAGLRGHRRTMDVCVCACVCVCATQKVQLCVSLPSEKVQQLVCMIVWLFSAFYSFAWRTCLNIAQWAAARQRTIYIQQKQAEMSRKSKQLYDRDTNMSRRLHCAHEKQTNLKILMWKKGEKKRWNV